MILYLSSYQHQYSIKYSVISHRFGADPLDQKHYDLSLKLQYMPPENIGKDSSHDKLNAAFLT